MALSVLWLALLSSLAYHVDCHGYLTRPMSRRLSEKKSHYTGITAFGAGQHITNCGKDGLSTPSSEDVVTDVRKGSIMKFDIVIDAHHAGHLEMRMCPFIIDGDEQDLSSCTLLQRASATEAGVSDCATDDVRDICASIDPNNPAWWFLGPERSQGSVHSMWFHIPSNVNCPNDRCTVQFTWKTANSCNPHPAAYCNYYRDIVGPQNTWCKNWYCDGFCNSKSNDPDNCEAIVGDRLCCSEVFTNCAEIKLIEGGSVPSPSPSTLAPTSFPAMPTATPSSAPTPTIVPSPTPIMPPSSCTGQPCADALHCRSKWGYCGSGTQYCNSDSTWTATGCSGTTPEPSSEPEPAPPVPAPAPEPQPATEFEPTPEPEPESETGNSTNSTSDPLVSGSIPTSLSRLTTVLAIALIVRSTC